MLRLNTRTVSASILLAATALASWPAAAELETRSVAPFRELSVSGPVSVEIAVGPESSLRVDGAQVRTQVSGGRLTIGGGEAGTAVVTLPRLDLLSLSGGARAQIADFAGGTTRMKVADASQVAATGRVDALELTLSGTGRAELAGLAAGDASVNVRGTGTAVVQAKSKLAVLVAGKGTVEHVGRPALGTDTHITGGGRVTQR